MGETSRVYFIPIPEQTDRPRPASSSPPRGGGAASSDTRRDCDCERRAASGERPLCACFDFNPRHSSHRVDAVDGEVPKVHPTIYIADFLLLSRPRSNRNLTKGNTRFIEVLFLGEPLCGFGFIFNPRVRGRLGDWGGEPIMGKGSRPSHPSHVMLTHSPFHLRSFHPSFLPRSAWVRFESDHVKRCRANEQGSALDFHFKAINSFSFKKKVCHQNYLIIL